jgi:hypothetical protein
VVDKVERYLIWAERFIRPRWLFMSEKNGERLVGLAIFIFAAVFALPIPLANFFPVLAVLIISMGFFNRDGLAIAIGIITGIFGVFIAMLVITVGYHGVLKMLSIIEHI